MDLRHCYMQVVNLCGCSAIPAENGQQALELLRRPSFHPKLVILDLMMPVMDGWTFLSERAKDPALNKVPVVVCSAAADRLPEGIRFMRKPISVDMLLSTVKEYCE